MSKGVLARELGWSFLDNQAWALLTFLCRNSPEQHPGDQALCPYALGLLRSEPFVLCKVFALP